MELSLACQKVGLFLHKFALLEGEINERLSDMLKLKGDAADAIATIDFMKKWSLLKTVALGQTPQKRMKRVERIFNAIATRNDNRVVVAHGRFDPLTKGSVQFKNQLWNADKFTGEFRELDRLRAKLKELKAELTVEYDEDGRSELVGKAISLIPKSVTMVLEGTGMNFAAQGVRNSSGSVEARIGGWAADQKKN